MLNRAQYNRGDSIHGSSAPQENSRIGRRTFNVNKNTQSTGSGLPHTNAHISYQPNYNPQRNLVSYDRTENNAPAAYAAGNDELERLQAMLAQREEELSKMRGPPGQPNPPNGPRPEEMAQYQQYGAPNQHAPLQQPQQPMNPYDPAPNGSYLRPELAQGVQIQQPAGSYGVPSQDYHQRAASYNAPPGPPQNIMPRRDISPQNYDMSPNNSNSRAYSLPPDANERLNKEQNDQQTRALQNQSMVNALDDMRRIQGDRHAQQKQEYSIEQQKRLDHIRQLQDEDLAAKIAQVNQRRKYKEDLDNLARSRKEMAIQEAQVNQMTQQKLEADIVGYQPMTYGNQGHLLMQPSNGHRPDVTRMTRKHQKTLCFNPITGNLKDTTLSTAEVPTGASSFVGPSKLQINFQQPYANAQAFQQPRFTRKHPKIHQNNPITAQTAGNQSYLEGDMSTTSYMQQYPEPRRTTPSSLQEYGNMAMNQYY